ncbi:EAL domain-containing protein [Halobacillus litoralis]|uniref:EAL domain-containing protein n=1 Tax=Halobacillus litoralis TaxID=45668 RepID=UPI001CD52238|nr:EAL domain-containing protein [Halobacillus litoralis]MCA0969286.1 EAL domain-containing protein [Halobacillus litoralis]
MEEMVGTYNPGFVILSVIIAVVASFASLQMVERLRGARKWQRWKWILSGGIMLGGGIWSMHFVAMLAYEMDMGVTYDTVLLTLSILSSAVASLTAFFLISQKTLHIRRLLTGAFFIGTGIISMHYVGMEAMIMPASIRYSTWLVGLSVVIAYTASFVALIVFRGFLNQPGKWSRYSWGAAVVLGAAICGMHYTGMEAAVFFPDQGAMGAGSSTIGASTLGYAVTIGILGLIGLFILLVRFDSKFENQSKRLAFVDQMYHSIIDTANDAVITISGDGLILNWNQGAESMFGHEKDTVLGEPLSLIIPEKYRLSHEDGLKRFLNTGVRRVVGSTVQMEGLHKSGQTFPVELSMSVTEFNEETYFTGIIRDISERVRHQDRIEELVYKDELTKLPNRRMLNEHLTSLIERSGTEKFAVLFFDLDRFKQINDVYGHRIGDQVLVKITERLRAHFESYAFLARQSGDEFVMVLNEASSYQAGRTAEALLKTFKPPIILEGVELFISSSVGIGLYPEDGRTADGMIKSADTAMYQAKLNGGARYQFFTADINESIMKKMMLETGLRKAVEKRELEIYYQPQVDVGSGEVNSFEALVRWNHPELGLISPVDFIPLAEETKLIVPMGEWILKEACLQFQGWINQGFALKHISVNISAVQFNESDFPQMVERVLKETGLDPGHLDLELTESVIQNPEMAIPYMHQLKTMGVRLSLDDFGTGYSSLSYLKDIPLDTLKIDKSFTQTVLENQKDRAVVDTIIQMALNLELNVIAEGVETDDQLHYLMNQKCHQYQGYLYSAPLPKHELEKLLYGRTDHTVADR